MLIGRFGDTSGAPYLEGRLYIPRLGIGGNISFLVDTGADETTLMPADGMRMNLPYEQLENPASRVGLGGLTEIYEHDAVVAFAEPGVALYGYRINLGIVPTELFKDVNASPPSLLGRDILRHWQMKSTPSTQELHFEVLSADHTMAL